MQTTAASWPRCLWLVALLLLPTPGRAQSDAVPLVIGGARTPRPDHLELLLELPPGTAAPQPQDIQLLEDARATARARAVAAFRGAGWNVATVVAVDTSRSMTKYLGPVRAALPEFVNRVPQNDAIAIITFDDDVHDRAPFATPRDQLLSRLGDLRSAGTNTVLHKALDTGVAMLDQRSGDRTRRRIVVISDGADESTGDPTATDAIIQRAVRSRVAIDTIWVGQPVAAKRNTLLRLAERTGGVHRDAVKAESVNTDVKGALRDVGDVATNAVIASFDREVQTSASTKEIGVSVARPGVAATSIALQVPRSVPSLINRPPDRESARDLIVRWTIRLAPLVPAAYASYSIVYIVVKKRNPKRRLPRPIPDRWIGIIALPTPEPPPPAPAPERSDVSRRQTMVAPDPRKDAAAGHVHGLVLEGVDGPVRGERIAVTGARYQIGAGNSNDLSITTDKYLSGLHARIEQSQGQWLLFDQGSANGTFVDGRRLGTGQGHVLRNGQSVKMGVSEFRVLIAAAAAAGAAPVNPIAPASPDDRPV